MPLEFALQHRNRFASPNPWKKPPHNPVTLTEQLGVDALPKQRCLRLGRSSLVLNLMVVGETGLGKTTFMNTLFNSDLTEYIVPKVPQKTTEVRVVPSTFELKEENVNMRLTVIDTPGFGDQLNREKDLEPIVAYIDEQFEKYLEDEMVTTERSEIEDNRVHALLYFIAPGSGIRSIDLIILKELSEKVNIIPVLAKADTLRLEEKLWNKRLIMNQILIHQIKTYPTDFCDEKDLISHLMENIPFAVMGSQTKINVDGKTVRGRKYRWGVVEVDNPEHCDFSLLQEMLMKTCLHDITDSTHSIHYAHYRSKKLRASGRPESILECDDQFVDRLENRKVEFSEDMQRKEEEMRQKFIQQVREKEAILREREEQLHKKGQLLMAEIERERRQIEAEERELEAIAAQRAG
ncbi:Septin-6 [Entomophthora muscae]|uniref:Septin-6 n=2 Tax=Entomophthora muscae TaxID=34485 RepID=A0ACC2USH5_9FUNG|nr:Septin-6 [Entomophthora muscae]KAJ9090093.1 Septin-6 [Entomophthora muscae]